MSALACPSSVVLLGATEPLSCLSGAEQPCLSGAEQPLSCPQRTAEDPGPASLYHLALHVCWARALRRALDRGRQQQLGAAVLLCTR